MPWMRISATILKNALELPEDTEMASDPTGNVRIEVDHSSIPPGTQEVTPVWKKEDEEITFLYFDYARRFVP